MESGTQFHIADYIVMVIFIVFSLGIGVYYGFYKKQTSTEEYLVGGRRMHLVPVALSMLVTFQSAISVIGVPADLYMYDSMLLYVWLGILVATSIQATVIVPLIYPLRLTSVYEYFYRRFNSRALQLLGTVLGMLQTLLYMSIVLFAPALALQAVANIPLWMSVILLGAVGTIYTAIGGIKSVVWTDVFQFVVLYGGLAAILVIGSLDVGGFSRIVEAATEGKRINFSRAGFDPRIRPSVWSGLIGMIFNWLPNMCNQSSIQRISSMRSTKEAQMSSFLNIPLTTLYGTILTLTGILLYGYFAIKECDPVLAGYVDNANQIMPYYVMRVLTHAPGLAGVFIAALFSGALSSLSSGINAMAANTLQDILPNCTENMTQVKKTMLAKLLVFVYGCVAVFLAYQAQNLSGPVTQLANTAFGAVGGPIAGIFFLGALFPQANSTGALTGAIISICVNIWVSVGSVLYGTKSPLSPAVPTTGCVTTSAYNATTNMTSSNYAYHMTGESSAADIYTIQTTIAMSPEPHPNHLAIYDISYMYFGLLGFLLSFIIGLVVSCCTGMDRAHKTHPDYLVPLVREYWAKRRGVESTHTYKPTGVKMEVLDMEGVAVAKTENQTTVIVTDKGDNVNGAQI